MQTDDSLWKAILEDIFDDFLRFFFENADEIFDINRGFEFLDKELEQVFSPDATEYSTRYVDKLVKVFLKEKEKNGNDSRWILVHIEVQGYQDRDFSKRMFTYFYRIFDRYDKPITAFAIFTDNKKTFQPKVFEQHFLGTTLRYEYNTYKILEQPEEKLLESENPFAIVVQTVKTALKGKKISENRLLMLKIALAKQLLTKQIPKTKIRSLMNFLRYYIRFGSNEASIEFEKQLEIVTNKNTTMGIEQFLLERAERQGIEKGIEKGIERGSSQKEVEKNTSFVKNLLLQSDFETEKIANIAGVTAEFVEQIKKSINQ